MAWGLFSRRGRRKSARRRRRESASPSPKSGRSDSSKPESASFSSSCRRGLPAAVAVFETPRERWGPASSCGATPTRRGRSARCTWSSRPRSSRRSSSRGRNRESARVSRGCAVAESDEPEESEATARRHLHRHHRAGTRRPLHSAESWPPVTRSGADSRPETAASPLSALVGALEGAGARSLRAPTQVRHTRRSAHHLRPAARGRIGPPRRPRRPPARGRRKRRATRCRRCSSTSTGSPCWSCRSGSWPGTTRSTGSSSYRSEVEKPGVAPSTGPEGGALAVPAEPAEPPPEHSVRGVGDAR